MVLPGPTVFSTNKTDHHDITEILLRVALNTIKPYNHFASCDLSEIIQEMKITLSSVIFFLIGNYIES